MLPTADRPNSSVSGLCANAVFAAAYKASPVVRGPFTAGSHRPRPRRALSRLPLPPPAIRWSSGLQRQYPLLNVGCERNTSVMNAVSEQMMPVSRVERVRQARHYVNASFRARAQSIPPIVVVSPSGKANDDTKMKLLGDAIFGSPLMPFDLTRQDIFSANVEVEDAYLHPRSAVETRMRPRSRASSVASEPRSCPTTPASSDMRSPGVPPGALALQLDAHHNSSDYRYIEIAMEVAEEAARICDSPAPLPTDVPLVYSGIGPRTVDMLSSWLMARYNYSGPAHTLMDEGITPEVLALNILCTPATPPPPSTRPAQTHHTVHMPDPATRPPRSGIIPITLAEPSRMLPAPRAPRSTAPSAPPETRRARTPPFPVAGNRTKSLRRVTTKRDLDLRLAPPRTPRTPSPVSAPVRPHDPPRVQPRRATDPPDAGASEPRSGKKAGFVVGLLAMGALLGAPSVPQRQPADTRDAPSPFANASTPLADLPRTPHSASGFAGLYGATHDSPSSVARALSPPELRSGGGGSYFWFALSPERER